MTQAPVATIDNDAAEIAELFKRGKSMAVAAVLTHLECGRRLELKKEELGHGNWLPWLEANKETLGFGELAAQRMMRAAKANPSLTKDLTEDEALDLNRRMWGNEMTMLPPRYIESDEDESDEDDDGDVEPYVPTKTLGLNGPERYVEKPPQSDSWTVEAVSNDDKLWRNGVRLATYEEAETYLEVFARQDVPGFRDGKIIKCDEPPQNSIFRTRKGGRPTLGFEHGTCGALEWSEAGVVSLEQKIAAARKHYVSLLMQLPKDSRVLEFAQCADQLDEADASDCPQTDEAEVALVIPSAEVPAASEPKKRGRPPGSKNKCKACGGTGRVIGTTGVSYDCDCVKADCAA
jgi:Protein of unknown function (DUF3102)